MEGDYVVKIGEFADEMYFIKSGEVEVLLEDGTRVAYMKEGAYFGEIGLLMTGKRTVSIRATAFSVFQIIRKKNFDQLMEAFPDQLKFLKRVARQRAKI
jgi:hypothetical protein